MGDFKMKGPALYPGYKKLKIARDYETQPDGRAKGSTPVQQSDASGKSIDQLIDEGFTPSDARRMQESGAMTGRKTTKKDASKGKNLAKKASKAAMEGFATGAAAGMIPGMGASMAIKKNESKSDSGVNYGMKKDSPAPFLKGLMGGVKNIVSGQGALGFLNPVAKAARIIGGKKAQAAMDNVVDNPASILAREEAPAMMKKYKK